ncbi:hypothetical protein RhiXN_02074 [Rhizoctonia solani]|uniref:Uncharacterized protein n=1 Tax=Rhizoctonia solani TaxID=456999 RepID=A0A8H8T335_9AGAM|nr:uncharacterized protein RhiXN_02074 [Rhizoctonia solani]QRW27479.1 hypothetical protein RhiXN_02074 [Rhizoctonia solani]
MFGSRRSRAPAAGMGGGGYGAAPLDEEDLEWEAGVAALAPQPMGGGMGAGRTGGMGMAPGGLLLLALGPAIASSDSLDLAVRVVGRLCTKPARGASVL